jgi:hypothetical protein
VDVSHVNQVIKCPDAKCGNNIGISQGSYRGGYNDYGGWILRCDSCKKCFGYGVKNPDDASSVKYGAGVVVSWDSELENMEQAATRCGVELMGDVPPRPVILPSTSSLVNFDPKDNHLYFCSSCKEQIEEMAYDELLIKLNELNGSVQNFLVHNLKGYANEPEGFEVYLPVKCTCGHVSEVLFYKPVRGNVDSSVLSNDNKGFWMVGVDNEESLPDIDGIYSRDECFGILDKLLLRWQARFHVVFLVVPFVGLQFPGTEAKRLAHWERVLAHTRPDKTRIITRRATFKLLCDAAEKEGLDFDFLRGYGILNESLSNLSGKDALFIQKSHAKIYCGISSDGAEVMSGSFNIHDGKYAENIMAKKYETADFFKRYLFDLGIWFDPNVLRSPRFILEARFCAGKIECVVNKYTGHLKSSIVDVDKY